MPWFPYWPGTKDPQSWKLLFFFLNILLFLVVTILSKILLVER